MKAYAPLDRPPGELVGGQPLEPGTTVELTDEQAEENAVLFETGQLLEVEEPAPASSSRKSAAAKEGEG